MKWLDLISRWRTGRRLPQPLVFMHIPKCGGTSVLAALLSRCNDGSAAIVSAAGSYEASRLIYQTDEEDPEKMWDRCLLLREHLLTYFMTVGCELISGHFAFSARAKAAYPRYQWMTMLRHPIDRWISNYLYNRHKTNSAHLRITQSAEEFVDTPRAHMWGSLYVRYLSGRSDTSHPASAGAVNLAKAHLRQFNLVGILEQPQTLGTSAVRVLGGPVTLSRLNQRPADARDIALEHLRPKLERICAPDLELYFHALATART
jgi:hypothetical protein